MGGGDRGPTGQGRWDVPIAKDFEDSDIGVPGVDRPEEGVVRFTPTFVFISGFLVPRPPCHGGWGPREVSRRVCRR